MNTCRSSGTLELLLRCIKCTASAEAVGQCLSSFAVLAEQEQNMQLFIRRGAVPILLDVVTMALHSGDEATMSLALVALCVLAQSEQGSEAVTRHNGLALGLHVLRDASTAVPSKQCAANLVRLLLAHSDAARKQFVLGPTFRPLLRDLLADPHNLTDADLLGMANAFPELTSATQLPLPSLDEEAFAVPETPKPNAEDERGVHWTLADFSPELLPMDGTTSSPLPRAAPAQAKEKCQLRPATLIPTLVHHFAESVSTSSVAALEPLFCLPAQVRRAILLRTLRRFTDPEEAFNHVVFDDVPRPINLPLTACPFSNPNPSGRPSTPTPSDSVPLPSPSRRIIRSRMAPLRAGGGHPKSASTRSREANSAPRTTNTFTRQTSSKPEAKDLGLGLEMLVKGLTPSQRTPPPLPRAEPAPPLPGRPPARMPLTPPLRFCSQFESGNLRRSIRVHEMEYDLLLNCDVGTGQYVQWFFFMVEGMQRGVTYHFNVLNMEKSTSQFDCGQRPVLFSERAYCQAGIGWRRAATDIAYLRNVYRRSKRRSGAPDVSHYTLHLSLHFPFTDDRVYIAYSQPYTFTDLQRHIASLTAAQPQPPTFLLHQVLCRTLADNHCPLLTITTLSDDSLVPVAQRPVIFISGRVHPGESAASWMVKGLLDFLCDSSNDDAKWLRDRFVWKVVPMLNPDGVINGNSRCSLAGVDLNRQWAECNRHKHPTVFWLKQYIRHVRRQEKRNVFLFCDFHGHSRQNDVFMYGCRDSRYQQLEEVLPCILARRLPFFSLEKCCYKLQKKKAAAGRVVAFQELGIPLSYTLEASLCGGSGLQPVPAGLDGAEAVAASSTHFNVGHYLQVGQCFARAIKSLATTQVDGSMFMDLLQSCRTTCSPLSPGATQGAPSRGDDDDADDAESAE
eukprot:GGOE01018439.1.p1 GENE.GGOE01018439.1~~GGOE01018439.1.p1  ORF type:complete len:1056 (-),score=284.37 GGOE01018439.1:285-2993(-)